MKWSSFNQVSSISDWQYTQDGRIHLMCVHIIFSSVSVAEWPPFGKTLLTRLTICFLFAILVISRFHFDGWILVMIASVPDFCISFTFTEIGRMQVSKN